MTRKAGTRFTFALTEPDGEHLERIKKKHPNVLSEAQLVRFALEHYAT